MTIKEVRDLFVVEYKLQCNLREAKEIEFSDKMIASWIASAQQDIVDRLGLLQTYYDLAYTPVSVFTTYSLPAAFGKLLRTEPQLTLRDITDLSTYSQDSSLPGGALHSIAVFNDGTGWKCSFMDLPTSSGTIRLWYTINTLFYSPSGATSQPWGSFDGSSFSGNLKIPEKYIDLLVLHMLAKVFIDKKEEYLFEMQRQRGNSSSTFSAELTYNLGDCKDE